jgi:hypothetical protein
VFGVEGSKPVVTASTARDRRTLAQAAAAMPA